MSARPLLFATSLALSSVATLAQSDDPTAPQLTPQEQLEQIIGSTAGQPDVDPYQIINESYNFRKEREPDMTAAEFALYERMSSMVETNPTFALQLLETMLGDDQDDSAAFDLALGNMYFSEDRIDDALARYTSAVTKYPEFLRGWVNIGMIHYQRQSWADAANAFAKAVNLGDRDAQTFGLLAFSLRQTGNTLGAEMAFMQAMTANPSDTNWIGGLLELYFINGRHAQSESLVRELVRLEPGKAENWMLYSSLLVSLKRPLEAATQLEIARELGTASPEALGLLGDLYVGLGLIPEAVAAYGAIPGDNEQLGAARLLAYARSMVKDGNLKEARSILAKIPVRADWELAKPRLFANAELAVAEGNWTAAQQAYATILNREPLNPYALLGNGHAYAELGDAARAEFAFENALQVPAAEHRACLELANLALADRRFPRAVQMLNRADALEPSSAIRSQIARINNLAAQ
ncbi:tetratricopeptide repeat protein [Synoicihabitans lomoniglobus]|uniref:Tetratricopeptide repeat protein n=1 Tax=Synoicihabitans lomoniglobus TaxID=2909285 RepID=A0AAE9ZZ75_9BACT|nr:tetratricopeptide repeat protein [Opitutaceae bacterium LMO-M01]WED64033.1 tetratricopeptide repeat protein [Opitutaceae bacterium LMO-M01]